MLQSIRKGIKKNFYLKNIHKYEHSNQNLGNFDLSIHKIN